MSFLSSLLNALPGAVAQGLIWGLMAIGVYITFRILDVADLTVDGSLATGGAVAVMLIRAGLNAWAALLCAFLAGMLAGFVTGLFHTKCGIPAILAGILTQLSLYSINLRIMGNKSNLSLLGKESVFTLTEGWLPQSMSRLAKLPVIVLMVAVICLLLAFFLKTKTGLSLRATGDNVEMVRSSSIDPHFTNALGLAIANGLVALSGAVLAQYQQYSDLNMGVGMVVIALAAAAIVVLGGYAAHGSGRLTRSFVILLDVDLGAHIALAEGLVEVHSSDGHGEEGPQDAEGSEGGNDHKHADEDENDPHHAAEHAAGLAGPIGDPLFPLSIHISPPSSPGRTRRSLPPRGRCGRWRSP